MAAYPARANVAYFRNRLNSTLCRGQAVASELIEIRQSEIPTAGARSLAAVTGAHAVCLSLSSPDAVDSWPQRRSRRKRTQAL